MPYFKFDKEYKINKPCPKCNNKDNIFTIKRSQTPKITKTIDSTIIQYSDKKYYTCKNKACNHCWNKIINDIKELEKES